MFVFVQVCKRLYSNVPKSGFILERNMHFVVANIVTPLTQSKGVSFVTLWGGRRVDYFVPLDSTIFCWQSFIKKHDVFHILPTFVQSLSNPASERAQCICVRFG